MFQFKYVVYSTYCTFHPMRRPTLLYIHLLADLLSRNRKFVHDDYVLLIAYSYCSLLCSIAHRRRAVSSIVATSNTQLVRVVAHFIDYQPNY